mgnify:CR=1 FL=1
MRILLMAQHYWPEDVSGAVLATELAEDLAGRGHNVSFVTCAPTKQKPPTVGGSFRNARATAN